MEQISYPYRIFQMWTYTVGMGRLLLRSTKTPTFETRIDILFQNVKALKTRSNLDGVSVRIASPSEQSSFELDCGISIGGETVAYVLEGAGPLGYVIAGSVTFHEDEGEYDDESALLGSLGQ